MLKILPINNGVPILQGELLATSKTRVADSQLPGK